MESSTHLVRNNGVPTTPAIPELPFDVRHGEARAHAYAAPETPRIGILLRRYWRGIAAIFCLCLLMGALVTFLMPPSYQAKTMLEVLAVNGDFLNNKNVDPNISTSTMDSYLETQTKLLTSATVADRVVASLLPNSAVYAHERMGGIARLKRWLGIHDNAPGSSAEQDIRRALSHMKVKAEGGSSLVSVTVTGPTPKIAADTANAVVEQHIAELQEARWKTASGTAEFLTAQLESQRKKLQASEQQLQDYARATGLVYTSDNDRDSIATEKLRQIQADLDRAEADRADKQAQMELIDGSPADSLPKVLDSPALREDKSRLTDLRRQLADLSATLTPSHYKVKEVEAQIAALEKQLVQERSVIVARIENDYHAAQRREQLQKKAYEQQLALVSEQSGKAVKYKLLQREVEANRELYQSTLQRIREASELAALRASNIRVVDKAAVPTLPSQPSLPLNLGISLLSGCMFSALFVLLRERSNQSIRLPGEMTRLLQVPELAIIPSARRDLRTQIVGAQDGNLNRLLARSSKRDQSSDVISNWHNSGSLVAESFRSAAASILLSGRERGFSPKVLVVTSAHPGAGKTTSVLNLGLALAESGRRVLLIDGDLRLPRLGPVFDYASADGLGDILAAQMSPRIAKTLIRPTDLPTLFVLPSGTPQSNVTQILHSSAFEALLGEVRSEYDFILIDSPPALPLADARLLARHSDGVILVCRSGSTTVEQSIAVRKSFLQDGTHVFGSILNDWNAQAEDPRYMRSYTKYARS